VTNVKGEPFVAIDPKGLIFAIGLHNSAIRLYDLRNFEQVFNRLLLQSFFI
jgi:hypothetical protein